MLLLGLLMRFSSGNLVIDQIGYEKTDKCTEDSTKNPEVGADHVSDD